MATTSQSSHADPDVRSPMERPGTEGPGEVVPGFGGLFLDEQDNGIVYVYMLDLTQQAQAERAAGIILQRRPFREVRVLQGRYAWGQLVGWYNEMRSAISAIPGLERKDVDEKANRIYLRYGPAPGTLQRVAQVLDNLGIPRGAVRVNVGAPGPPVPANPDVRALQLRVGVTPSLQLTAAGEPATFSLIVGNGSPAPVGVEYGLSTRFVVTRPDDSILWDSLNERGAIRDPLLRRWLAPGEELTSAAEPTLSVVWQQRDNEGNTVAPGSYRVHAVFDAAGGLAAPPVTFSVLPENLDWDTLTSQLQTALANAFPEIIARAQTHPISIMELADVTGDGYPEALVYMGAGGATTEYAALVMVEGGKVVVPPFKRRDRSLSALWLPRGAGGAGRYEHSIGLLQSAHAVYWARFSKYGEPRDYCLADVFVWNPTTGAFEFDEQLSDEMREDYCRTHG